MLFLYYSAASLCSQCGVADKLGPASGDNDGNDGGTGIVSSSVTSAADAFFRHASMTREAELLAQDACVVALGASVLAELQTTGVVLALAPSYAGDEQVARIDDDDDDDEDEDDGGDMEQSERAAPPQLKEASTLETIMADVAVAYAAGYLIGNTL